MLQLGIRGLGIARFKFNPISWFLKGEPGAWYDPSDFQPNWRRNLLTYTEDFSNAVWLKPNSSVVGGFIAPDGSLTANSLTGTGVGVSWIRHDVISPSVVCTISYRVKADTSSFFAIGDVNFGNLGSFNLITGVPTGTGTSMLPLENGWYLCSVTYNSIAGYSRHVINPSATYTGITTLGVLIWHPQIENSSSASTYQKITDGIQDYYTVQPQPVLFQDSAGTTPVTAVEQPVGLMLDKSKGLALGAELVTNGDFSNGSTGWGSASFYTASAVVTSGELIVTANTANGVYLQSFTTVIGQFYKVSGYIRRASGSTAAAQLATTDGAGNFIALIGSTTSNTSTFVSGYVFATATTTYIGCRMLNVADTGGYDNISVKQIAGNHAFQGDSTSTPAKRPMLSARVNLLTKTEDFSTAPWLLGNNTANLCTVTNVSNTNPLGVTTLISKIDLPAVSTGNYSMVYLPIAVISTEYTASIYLKGLVGGENVYLMLTPDGTSFGSVQCTLTTSWQKFTVPKTSSSTLLYYQVGVDLRNSTQSAKPAQSFYAWGADLRPTNSGALLPPYQRVNTASDYDTVGFPLYLKANGTSSAMSTNSIDFSSTDKMTVVTGVRKLSDAVGYPVIAELSASVSTLNGSFALFALTATTGTYLSSLRGSTLTEYSMATFNAPISNVLSDSYNIAGTNRATNIIPKINGATPTLTGLSGANAGSGNFGNYPLYLFARSNTSLFLNGQFYGAIIRGAQSDTASVTQTENYMATKTGITF